MKPSTPSRPEPYASTIAISAGVAALVAGGLVFLFAPPPASLEPSLPATPSIDSSKFEALEQRLGEIEAKQLAASASKPPKRVQATPKSQAALVALAQRVTRLETQLTEVTHSAQLAKNAQNAQNAQNAKRATLPVARSRVRDPAALAKRVQENQLRILDPQLSEQEKLEAWKALRNLGKDAWNDRVVLEMSRIGLTSLDARVRADVWRQADANAMSPALVPSLLQALANDSAAKAREEAAETLENYTSDPSVLQALELAKRNDQDSGVRRQARRSLDRAQRKER